MTNMSATHREIKNLLNAYAVHGGDAASSVDHARELRTAEIAALSIDYVRPSRWASYRIATLADGSRYLAVRYRGRTEWLPVFSAARLERLVASYGWKLEHAA